MMANLEVVEIHQPAIFHSWKMNSCVKNVTTTIQDMD
jgi:hypothetical protein